MRTRMRRLAAAVLVVAALSAWGGTSHGTMKLFIHTSSVDSGGRHFG